MDANLKTLTDGVELLKLQLEKLPDEIATAALKRYAGEAIASEIIRALPKADQMTDKARWHIHIESILGCFRILSVFVGINLLAITGILYYIVLKGPLTLDVRYYMFLGMNLILSAILVWVCSHALVTTAKQL